MIARAPGLGDERWELEASAGSAMVPPMASAPTRHAVPPRASRARNRREIERLRARRRRPERHAARFLLAALLSAVLLLTLLLTAFGTWSAEPVATKPLATPAVLPGGEPLRQIVATAGGLHLQLPVSQSAVTAIGYHHAGDGSLMLDPIGRQGNAGLFARLWHKLAGTSETSLVWYQLRGDRGPGTSVLSVGAAPRHRRLLARRRHRGRDHGLRALEPDATARGSTSGRSTLRPSSSR